MLRGIGKYGVSVCAIAMALTLGLPVTGLAVNRTFVPSIRGQSVSGQNLFGRSSNQLFQLGGLLINDKFDLTFGFPQPVPNSSRLRVPNPQLVNQNLKDRTVLVADPKSGIVNREYTVDNAGRILERETDPFG